MQRFHPTFFLGVLAAFGALVAPEFVPHVEPVVVPAPSSVERGPLGIRAGLDRPLMLEADERYVVVEVDGLQAIDRRQPLELVLAIDVSGSMAGGRIRDARLAVEQLVAQLQPQDRVSVIAFANQAYEVVERGTPQQALSAVKSLHAHGNTNIEDALQRSYDLWPAGQRAGRVLLLSDGQANIGHDSAHELIADAAQLGDAGIEVSAIGLGTGIDQTALMGIADATGGDYLYLSSPGEVAAAFADQLDALREQAARQTHVELVLADGVELLDVYGYEEVDGRATDRGWVANLGAVSTDAPRKVVARVRVPREVAESGRVGRVHVTWLDREHRSASLPLRVAVGDPDVVEGAWWAADHVLAARTGRAMDEVLEAPDADALAVAQGKKSQLAQLAQVYGVAPTVAPIEKLESGWLVAAPGTEERIDLESLAALEALGYLE